MTYSRIFRPVQPGVRARRIDLGESIKVETKTLGTALSFIMAMENLSRSGLLLSKGRNLKVPFQVNTLVEITVDPETRMFDRPVICLGKVVRFGEASGRQASLGVKIVQMDTRDSDAWEKCVTLLETSQEMVLLPASVAS